nr:DUF4760 domain-containing protein [Pacificimonas pallii]
MQRHTDWPSFDEKLRFVRLLADKGAFPDITNLVLQADRDAMHEIDYILDYYEYVAVAVWNGTLDENFVKECENSRFQHLSDKLKPYIEQNRTLANSDDVWRSLETLADRWKRIDAGTYRDWPHDRLLSLLLMRPVPPMRWFK